MSWTERFTTVVEGASGSTAPGRAELDAHLDAVIKGEAGPPTPPSLRFESEAEELAARTAWVAWLHHGELLASLGLRERERTITVVELGSVSLAIRAVSGEPLLVIASLEALLDDPALLDALAGRELIVVGDAGMLLGFAEGLGDRLATVEVRQVLISRLPALPAAARLLQERYQSAVGAALADPEGGWLAVGTRYGELLMPVRPQEDLHAIDRFGDRVEFGGWGMLATLRSGTRRLLRIWARLGRSRTDEPGVEIGVPETPLETDEGLQLNVQDLHNLLGALPVFAYSLQLRDEVGTLLQISMLPGVELDQAKAAIEAAGRVLHDLPIEFREPGIEFDGLRVDDQRVADLARLVEVVWAGAEQSQARRGAWRTALASAGVSGKDVVVLLDGAGEPFTDPLAHEVLASLLDQDRADSLFEVRCERTIVVGKPAAGLSADGWIRVLEADEARDGMFVAGHKRDAVARVAALFSTGAAAAELAELTLKGVHMHSYTRPTLALGRPSADHVEPLFVDPQRCTGAGDCVQVCPTKAITLVEQRPVIDAAACIRCHLCSERCDQLALRPYTDSDAFVDSHTLVREAPMLAQIRDRVRPRRLEGKLAVPPAVIRRKPTVVLGLATVTLMEHAAALLIDGQLVTAIEEERLARVRHYSFQHPDRPGASLSSEACMRLEEAWPQRSIRAVLEAAKLTMDDVDVVAINGIPARLRHSFSGGGGWRPPPVLRANSVVFVPHHMTHAASVYGLSGFDEAWVLSIDGRGDYETATIWRAEGHELEIVDAVPWLPDCSFGGVYETATRVLGFGSHGQGSTMALAALGEPVIDVSDCMGFTDDGAVVLSEWAAEKRFAPYQRGYDDELTDEHKNLAASIQRALETTVGEYLARHAGDLRGQNLGLCGGVALNCRMNGTLRARFAPAQMHVAPGANDAGTAIGAAMIGHRELTGELPRLDLGHTHLGPAWSDEAIARTLERLRVPFQRLREVGRQTAELLAAGKIVCWFQGPMEFGPRALGGRSILADPRREDLKVRLNAMKSRQPWRPFGSSVLAGRQGEWFTHDWDSRFMLFAVDVRPEKRGQIPVVVHHDGSTRPQVVHREHHGRYHDLISAFDGLTGVPMVVNTSFNRGGEPIVCNPVEALRSFAGLGADAIVLGDCLVRRELLRRR
ncbi:MAG: carbamoyltransferase C-terminal domain-containing protein [Enhygromyxa sp.]